MKGRSWVNKEVSRGPRRVEARIAVMDVKRKTKRKAERSRKGSARLGGRIRARETTPVTIGKVGMRGDGNWEVGALSLFSWLTCPE